MRLIQQMMHRAERSELEQKKTTIKALTPRRLCLRLRPRFAKNHALLSPISSAYGNVRKSPTATYVGFLLTRSAATCIERRINQHA